jgi:hypothetical protein
VPDTKMDRPTDRRSQNQLSSKKDKWRKFLNSAVARSYKTLLSLIMNTSPFSLFFLVLPGTD